VAWLKSQGEETPAQSRLSGIVKGKLAPDTRLIGSILKEHYKAVGNLAGEQATRKAIAALKGATRAQEAAPDTLPWSTPSSRYDTRKAAGYGARTGNKPPNPDGRTTLQERLALGKEWDTALEGIGFNLRDPAILAELSKRGTLIKGEVSATMLQDLRDMLATQFYREGQSPAALAKDIQRIFPMTYWGRAQTIARTETGFAQQAVQHEAFKRDGVPEKQWHASFRNTRDTHARAHGQVQKTEEPFLVGGVYMMHPHAAGAPPELTINCNCESMPQYPEDAVGIPASPWLGEGE
jgi:SPP1 gp7 family putative phage head morphogenesis protein